MLRYLAVAVILLECGHAAADVGLTVWAGAGGAVRADSTVCIVVQLQNDGVNRTGIVKAAFNDFDVPLTWATQPLDLPPQARKRVFLYLPHHDYAGAVTVRYEAPNGRIVSEYVEQLKLQGAEIPVVASVGEWPAGLPPAQEKEKQIYASLQLQPDLLPDRFDGLEMYDALILTPPPHEPLPTPQVEALREWVLRGGNLAVDVSQRVDAYRQGPLLDLLPFLPATTEQRPLSKFGRDAVFATGEMGDGQILLESDGLPLVVRRNLGLGSVVCFAIAPADPSFVQWPEHEALWKNILGAVFLDPKPQDATAGLFGQWSHVEDMTSNVSLTPDMPLRLGLVLLLTGLYALVVGPGDYFLVRWLGKPRLTWITFPTIVIVFTVAAYAGAKAWIGGEMMSKSSGRVLVLPEEGIALNFDLAGLFVPTAKDYEIRHNRGVPLTYVRAMAEPDNKTILDQERSRIVQRIPIWTQRVYAARYTTGEYPDVRLALQRQPDGTPEARIQNFSDQTLTNCRIAYGEALYRVQEQISPGHTVSVPLPDDAVLASLNRTNGAADGDFGIWDTRPGSQTAFTREFRFHQALRRGALVLEAGYVGAAPNPLVVDGQQRPERNNRELYVLVYPGERS